MRIVFLDRDGVINRFPGYGKYVTSLRKFRFLPKAKSAIARLSKAGFRIFVISNQAGVGKGIYSLRTLQKITLRMLTEIERSGGRIEGVYYCTHPKEAKCACRKPKPGMVKRAMKEHGLKIKDSFFIGDTIRDVKTARASGLNSILLLCGDERVRDRSSWEAEPDHVFKDLASAASFVIRKGRS